LYYIYSQCFFKFNSMETIFVGDLSYFCTDQDLRRIFQPFGPVKSASVRRSANNESLHYGFVQMKAEDATMAFHGMQGKKVMGRHLKLNMDKMLKMTNLRQHSIQLHVSFICSDTKLVVNEELLYEMFSSYGTVLDCVIKQYTLVPEASKQCGYGFVFYEDMAAVENAIASTKDVIIRNIQFDCTLSHDSHNRLHQPNSSSSPPPAASQPAQSSPLGPNSSSPNPQETKTDSSRSGSKAAQTLTKVQVTPAIQTMAIAPSLMQFPSSSSSSPPPIYSFHPVVPSDTMTVATGMYAAQGYASLPLPPPISTAPGTAGQAHPSHMEQSAPVAAVPPGMHSLMLPPGGAMVGPVPTRIDEYAMYPQLQAPMQAIPSQHAAYTAVYASHPTAYAPATVAFPASATPTTSGPANATAHFAPGFYQLSHPSPNNALKNPFNYSQNSPQMMSNHSQIFLQPSNYSPSSSMSGFHPSYYFHHSGHTPSLASSSSGSTPTSIAAISVAATAAPSPLRAHQFSLQSHQHPNTAHPIPQQPHSSHHHHQHLPASSSLPSSSSSNPHSVPLSSPHHASAAPLQTFHPHSLALPLPHPHHSNTYFYPANSNSLAPSSAPTNPVYQAPSHPSHTPSLSATYQSSTIPFQPGSHHLHNSTAGLNSNTLNHSSTNNNNNNNNSSNASPPAVVMYHHPSGPQHPHN
jgi:hypothetical protein